MGIEVLEDGQVQREVTIDAAPEEVWEALATEQGRERWLEPDPDRVLLVETAQAPERLVWWWWHGEQPARRVELRVVAVPDGSRVLVTETAPRLPLTRLTMAFAGALCCVAS